MSRFAWAVINRGSLCVGLCWSWTHCGYLGEGLGKNQHFFLLLQRIRFSLVRVALYPPGCGPACSRRDLQTTVCTTAILHRTPTWRGTWTGQNLAEGVDVLNSPAGRRTGHLGTGLRMVHVMARKP
ncbi:hypothetical protein LX32DRAFT_285993 [Colletotrichum zoysiae]|uniref:Secreted protein n=1 Tax=Colletotrichum zoysiae TaxID=1216348 RepID=A0AAD9H2B0_9PEZI|nr:hypothetical protein LX32DRAFT_285993 [Colletotrichum zoysiae]